MKILFLHGLGVGPGGLKPTYLRSRGHEVTNPALDDGDFARAVRAAQAAFDGQQPDVVVGSSRGGAVALGLDSGGTPLVLLCPAWKNRVPAAAAKPGTTILHSPDDENVPFGDSVELVREAGLPEEALIAVGSDHRLGDPDSLRIMLEACERAVAGRR